MGKKSFPGDMDPQIGGSNNKSNKQMDLLRKLELAKFQQKQQQQWEQQTGSSEDELLAAAADDGNQNERQRLARERSEFAQLLAKQSRKLPLAAFKDDDFGRFYQQSSSARLMIGGQLGADELNRSTATGQRHKSPIDAAASALRRQQQPRRHKKKPASVGIAQLASATNGTGINSDWHLRQNNMFPHHLTLFIVLFLQYSLSLLIEQDASATAADEVATQPLQVGDRAHRSDFERLVEVTDSNNAKNLLPLGSILAAQLVPWIPPFLNDHLIVLADPRRQSGDVRQAVSHLLSSSDVNEILLSQVIVISPDLPQETKGCVQWVQILRPCRNATLFWFVFSHSFSGSCLICCFSF
jgi:hypothetical protein